MSMIAQVLYGRPVKALPEDFAIWPKPFPIPKNIGTVRTLWDKETPKFELKTDEGMHACATCRRQFKPEDMHIKLDGHIGKQCKQCDARNKHKRHAPVGDGKARCQSCRMIYKLSGMYKKEDGLPGKMCVRCHDNRMKARAKQRANEL